MKELIHYARTDDEINEALIDITEFKPGQLNRISSEDYNVLKKQVLSSTQRKKEVRSFIMCHPALMSGDYETMIDKVMYYLAQVHAEKKKKRTKQTKQTRRIMERNFKTEASNSEQEDVPDDAKSSSSKVSKKSSKKKSKQKEESDSTIEISE